LLKPQTLYIADNTQMPPPLVSAESGSPGGGSAAASSWGLVQSFSGLPLQV